MPHASPLADADTVRIIKGAGFDARNRRANEQLAAESTPSSIAELADLVLDWTDAEPAAWMEWPSVSLVFLSQREVVAEFGLLAEAKWIRTPNDGDRRLARSADLALWLARHEVDLT